MYILQPTNGNISITNLIPNSKNQHQDEKLPTKKLFMDQVKNGFSSHLKNDFSNFSTYKVVATKTACLTPQCQSRILLTPNPSPYLRWSRLNLLPGHQPPPPPPFQPTQQSTQLPLLYAVILAVVKSTQNRQIQALLQEDYVETTDDAQFITMNNDYQDQQLRSCSISPCIRWRAGFRGGACNRLQQSFKQQFISQVFSFIWGAGVCL
eukprot:TRINITY_DN28930_c0_g1_i7.p1 TRINITY_DN28930_c0_g1~~TRINITY_DN28930_c0_g1_i7.p1  ORF type:complete len:208 (-),score=4.20 TRINITY_DN28930_c0_g1_i7:17-640(-)